MKNHFASLSHYRSSKDYKIMLINNITQPSVGADLSRPPPIYRPSWRVSPYPDLKVTLHYRPSWVDITISSFHSQCTSSASQMHFDCPKVHWKRLRTTNVIERLFVEVRRRIRTMCAFTTRDSCERILFSVFDRMNQHWTRHPLPAFTHNS